MLNYSFLDRALISFDNGIRSLFSKVTPQRANPAKMLPEPSLSLDEQKKSAALMRINHTGEVCAQALYYGQALVAQSATTKAALLTAAEEEIDHLSWCQERLQELHGHTSYLNSFWYLASFSIGLLAGAINDQWSLGFVVETERQVEQHLKNHLQHLPRTDQKSRLILEQMCEDEAHHATVALGAGAVELPSFVKKLMQGFSKVMTKTTYYL